jgi:pimeloyl-ACP methyl ester carboxylesterase
MRLFLWPVLFFGLLHGCGNSAHVPGKADTAASQAAKPVVNRGVIQAWNAGNGSRFQLYIPASADTSKPLGVVLFLDPHADGFLPLQKYKSLADSLGLVFAGSDFSANGVPAGDIEAHLNAVKQSLPQLFRMDAQRYFLCGFSGGARVAASLAAGQQAAGVVLCSAAPQQALPQNTALSGVAGLGDMNYLEMRNWFASSPSGGLYLFAGEHNWPPAATLAMALNGMLLQSNQASAQNALLFARIASAQIDSLSRSDCDLAAALYANARNCLSNFPAQKQQLETPARNALASSDCARRHSAARMAAENKEKELQTEIQQSVFAKDPAWWQENADKLFEAPAAAGSEQMMRKRVRGYASLLCYSYSNRALKSNNPNGADKLITTYSIIDPKNSEWAYMRACLDARLGMPDLAFEALTKAVQLGFADKNRAAAEADLASLRNDQRWQLFLSSMNK